MKYGRNKRYRKVARKSGRKTVKRINRKKLRGYGSTRSSSINGPMALRQVVKMRYSEDINLGTGVGGLLYNYDFRANSIFDPNLTGSGHQPLGHDQWAQFYDHYVVLGAKMRVTFTNPSNTDTSFCAIAVQDMANTMSNQAHIREQPRSRWTLVPNQGGNNQKSLVCNYSAKKFFGAKSVVTWDKLGSAMGNNPTEDALFRIFYQNATSTSSYNIVANVIIDYIVLLSEPKVLTQS